MRNIANRNPGARLGMMVLSGIAILACLGLTPELADPKLKEARDLITQALNANIPDELKHIDYSGRNVGKADANTALDKASRDVEIGKLTKSIETIKSRLDTIQKRIDTKNGRLKQCAEDIDTNANQITENKNSQNRENNNTPPDPAVLSMLADEETDLNTTRSELKNEINALTKALCDDFKQYQAKKQVLADQETSLAGLGIIQSIMECGGQ